MITHLEIALSETDLELNTNMSSVMHGAIMEIVSGEFAEEMHKQAIRPYSQSVYKIADNKWIWSINALNDYAAQNIINVITNSNSIYIKNREAELSISNYSIYKTSFDDLFTNNYLSEKRSRYLTMEFITPTAFKSNEKYVFMPDIALIMKSIISKYDTLSTTTDIMDDNLLDKIVENVSISEYRIRSRYFYLEKTSYCASRYRPLVTSKSPILPTVSGVESAQPTRLTVSASAHTSASSFFFMRFAPYLFL